MSNMAFIQSNMDKGSWLSPKCIEIRDNKLLLSNQQSQNNRLMFVNNHTNSVSARQMQPIGIDTSLPIFAESHIF